MFDLFYGFQFLTGGLFVLVNLIFRVKHRQIMNNYSKFSVEFFYTLNIIVMLYFYFVLLLFLFACVFDCDSDFSCTKFSTSCHGFSYMRINVILLIVTILGFIMLILQGYLHFSFSPIKLMKIFLYSSSFV